MSFLAPLVLTGMAAAGVPVLIHLLNKFRVNRTDWGAMRFLADAVQKNQRKVKLDELILLVMRCLLIALAVLAFARPALKGLGAGGGEPVAAVILLDHSASMGQSSGALSRFDQAKAKIREWLDKQNEQSLIGLYLAGERTVPLIGKPENDFALFRKSLDGAQVSDHGSDFSQSLRLAVESLKNINGRAKEIRIYTDGQTTAFVKREEMKLLARENPDIGIQVIADESAPSNNLGIVSIRQEGGVPSVGQPVRFHAEVMNSGSTTAKDVKVDLTLGDGKPAGSALIPTIAPGETQAVKLSATFGEAGPQALSARIPADEFSADNRRDCALEISQRIEVAIVENSSVENAGVSGGYFLSRALVPVPLDQADRYFLSPRFVRPVDLPVSLERTAVDWPEIVFLCEPAGLTADTALALESYVKSGGNLVVFPGSSSKLGVNDTPEALARLLPGTLGEPVETAAGETPAAWQADGFDHAITRFWNDRSNGNLGAVTFTRHCDLTPKPDPAVRVMTGFRNGMPSVIEWPVGRGGVVLFNANLGRDWTNLALHPAFVPFAQRLIGFLHDRNAPKHNLTPGTVFRMNVDAALVGKDFTIRQPGSDAARTAGQIAEDADGAYLRYASTDAAGAYQIAIGTENVATFAVQMDPSESDLRRADTSVFKDLSEIPRTAATGGDARMVVKKEYWTALIACAALLFLAEAAMAHRMSYAR